MYVDFKRMHIFGDLSSHLVNERIIRQFGELSLSWIFLEFCHSHAYAELSVYTDCQRNTTFRLQSVHDLLRLSDGPFHKDNSAELFLHDDAVICSLAFIRSLREHVREYELCHFTAHTHRAERGFYSLLCDPVTLRRREKKLTDTCYQDY